MSLNPLITGKVFKHKALLSLTVSMRLNPLITGKVFKRWAATKAACFFTVLIP